MLDVKNAFTKALVRWAWDDDEKVSQLESWLDSAIEACAQGRGSISASTVNGVSVSNFSAGMTNMELVVCLSKALDHLEQGTWPTSRVQAIL